MHASYSLALLRFPPPCSPVQHQVTHSPHRAGSYSASTIKNYVAGVRAWHILHRLPWKLSDEQVEVMVRAAKTITPAASKRKPRDPYTIPTLLAIRAQLNLTDPLDVAVWACATSLFYGAARAGELTVPKLGAFDPTLHVQRSNVTLKASCNRDEVTEIYILHTKTTPTGEAIYWAKQNDDTDPLAALDSHLALNKPHPGEHLFVHTIKGARRPLTKKAFLVRISSAAAAAKLTPLQGHSFRIGGTLEYLLRGLPFDTMRVKGRWASAAFLKYLRHHSEVMAPYMQANPAAYGNLLRITLPSDSAPDLV